MQSTQPALAPDVGSRRDRRPRAGLVSRPRRSDRSVPVVGRPGLDRCHQRVGAGSRPRARQLTGDPETPPTSRGRTLSWRRVVALTLVIALFLSASAGIGLLIWDDSVGRRRPSHRPAGPGPALRRRDSATAPIGHLDQSSRTATIGAGVHGAARYPVRALPGSDADWLVCWTSPSGRAPRCTRATTAGTTGRPPSCSARCRVLWPPVIWRRQGRLTMQRLGQTFFDQHAIEVKDVSWSDHSVDQHPGLLFSATMGYSVPNVPSRFDRVTAHPGPARRRIDGHRRGVGAQRRRS